MLKKIPPNKFATNFRSPRTLGILLGKARRRAPLLLLAPSCSCSCSCSTRRARRLRRRATPRSLRPRRRCPEAPSVVVVGCSSAGAASIVAVGSSLARHRVCVPLSPPTPHPSVRAPPRLSANRNPFPPSTTQQRGVERDFVAAAEPPHARTPSPARVQSPPPPCWRDPPPPGAARAAPR